MQERAVMEALLQKLAAMELISDALYRQAKQLLGAQREIPPLFK